MIASSYKISKQLNDKRSRLTRHFQILSHFITFPACVYPPSLPQSSVIQFLMNCFVVLDQIPMDRLTLISGCFCERDQLVDSSQQYGEMIVHRTHIALDELIQIYICGGSIQNELKALSHSFELLLTLSPRGDFYLINDKPGNICARRFQGTYSVHELGDLLIQISERKSQDILMLEIFCNLNLVGNLIDPA